MPNMLIAPFMLKDAPMRHCINQKAMVETASQRVEFSWEVCKWRMAF